MYGYGSREYSQLNPVQKRFFDAFQEHPALLGYDDLRVDGDVEVEVKAKVMAGEEEYVLTTLWILPTTWTSLWTMSTQSTSACTSFCQLSKRMSNE